MPFGWVLLDGADLLPQSTEIAARNPIATAIEKCESAPVAWRPA